MLVRIKGVIEDIQMLEGRSRDDRPWAKKTYVIRDTMYNKPEYNTKVHVQDFGKLDLNATTAVFNFHSEHIKGEEVDLACYLETNDAGFTNVNYGKPYDQIQVQNPKPNTGDQSVIRAKDIDAAPAELEETSKLPF